MSTASSIVDLWRGEEPASKENRGGEENVVSWCIARSTSHLEYRHDGEMARPGSVTCDM